MFTNMQHYVILVEVASLILPAMAADYPGDSIVTEELNIVDDERHVRRLADLMRSYVERAEERLKEIMGIKKEVEEKSVDQKRAFEMGYMMGDVIETYRKALAFTKKQMFKKRYIEADRIRYMTYVQNAYIKVYHLVHMMHEINPKYGSDNSGQMTKANINYKNRHLSPTFFNNSGFYYTKQLNEIREDRMKAKMKKIRDEGKIKEAEIRMYGTMKPSTPKVNTKWWPVEYGWDMDYYW